MAGSGSCGGGGALSQSVRHGGGNLVGNAQPAHDGADGVETPVARLEMRIEPALLVVTDPAGEGGDEKLVARTTAVRCG